MCYGVGTIEDVTCKCCGRRLSVYLEPPGPVYFATALNSGKPFRRVGSLDAEGKPLWWTRNEVSELLRDINADDFMRLLNTREWEIQNGQVPESASK